MNDPKASADHSLLGKTILGSYEIVDRLGAGGMGAVYLARQPRIEQQVAIKVLHADTAEDAETVERFHREARAIAMLTHPNIIRVFVFGETEEGLTFMVMEHVEGQSLRQAVDDGPMDELRIIKLLKQITSALAEAHDLGIVHRDLKPENILLTRFRGETNFVKVLDFGIAKIKDPHGGQPLTQAGIVYGTPEYIAPEQAIAGEIDHRTDLYSLGCMLYELYTGQVPFQGKSALKTLEMQAFQKPRPPREVAPHRDNPLLEAIIAKAMEKDPKQRYGSALEMFDDLHACEAALLAERNMDARKSYIPGGELSGIFRAVKPADAPAPATLKGVPIRTFLIVNIVGLTLIVVLLVVLIVIFASG